jgi:hypothetical protein
MRTTVTLDADVESLVRDRVRKTKRPFKFVLNDALRTALRGTDASAVGAPFTVEARPLGLLPGHDPRGMAKTADDLEAEAFLSLTRRLEEARKS